MSYGYRGSVRLPREVAISESLMDIVFGPTFLELMKVVAQLEDRKKSGRKDPKLVEALDLSCKELSILATFTFSRIVGSKKDRKRARKLALSLSSDEGFAQCARIGAVLDRYDKGRLHLKERFFEMYAELCRLFAETATVRSTGGKAPDSVVSLRDATCGLAKQAQERVGRGAVLDMLNRTLQVTLVFGGLLGIEQDLPGFLDDVRPVVEVMMHGVEHLVTHPEFLVDIRFPDNPEHSPYQALNSPAVVMPRVAPETPPAVPETEVARAESAVTDDSHEPVELVDEPDRAEELESDQVERLEPVEEDGPAGEPERPEAIERDDDPVEDVRDPLRAKPAEPDFDEFDPF